MNDYIDNANSCFSEALNLEELARQAPINIDKSLEAASKFHEAAEFLQKALSDPATDPDVRTQATILASYYFSQEHKQRSWYHYEKHNMSLAGAELNYQMDFLKVAIESASKSIQSLPSSESGKIKRMLVDWKLDYLLTPAAKWAHEARRAWDEKRFVDALDSYRQCAVQYDKALKYIDKNKLQPSSRRITLGNFITMMANASQALATIAHSQICTRSGPSGQIPRSLVCELLRYTFDAYETGRRARSANPEWQQIIDTTNRCRENLEWFLANNKPHWLQFYCEFENEPEFLNIMKGMDMDTFKSTETKRRATQSKATQLWVIGSFWLFVAVVIACIIAVLFRALGLWAGIFAAVVIEVVLLIVGALVLRTTDDLSEANLLKLIGMAAQFQMKSLVQLIKTKDKRLSMTEKETSQAESDSS